jgi:predicted secreted Zn-dependent protease
MSVTVVVSPTQLTWTDFAPVDSLPDGSGDEAQTATTMSPLTGIQPVSTQGKFSLPNLTLTVGLDRTQTLVVKTAQKTADLLKHEQGHFDITVLTVRAMAKEFEQLKAGSPPALGQQLNAVVSKHQQRANMIEVKYDKDTNGSRDQDAQKSWNQAIDAAMKGSGGSILQGMPL